MLLQITNKILANFVKKMKKSMPFMKINPLCLVNQDSSWQKINQLQILIQKNHFKPLLKMKINLLRFNVKD